MFSRSTIFLGLMLTGGLALASFVREDTSAATGVVVPVVRNVASTVPAVQSDSPTLQLEKLARPVAAEPEGNLFANKSWYVQPPFPPLVATLKEEEVKPVAPNLPFVYMGRIQEEGEKTVVFLTKQGEALMVRAGDEVDRNYRLESVTPTELVFHYLPLNIRQSMIIGNDLAAIDGFMEDPQGGLTAQSRTIGGMQQ